MSVPEFPAAIHRLKQALRGDLPGAAAQGLMASRPGRDNWITDLSRIPGGTRDAAVLVVVYPSDGVATVTLTRRTDIVESHRKQISFPGGAVEAGETIRDAALREAHEETRLDPATVEVLGELTPLHVPVSRFLVHPVVAVSSSPPVLEADPTEVDEILEARIDRLVNPGSIEWVWMDRPRGRLLVPYFVDGACRVWGATAMMLAELLVILGWEGPPEPSDS